MGMEYVRRVFSSFSQNEVVESDDSFIPNCPLGTCCHRNWEAYVREQKRTHKHVLGFLF